jgi:hypothetical protein
MKLRLKEAIPAVATAMVLGFTGVGLTGHAAAQSTNATSQSRPPAGVFFKAVTTSSLKGLSVDDFLQAMGVMAAGLGIDCSDCHPGAGSDKVDWVIDTPNKVTARKMVEMVAVINKTNFGGAQRVTCWTCHHGRTEPTTTVTIQHLYGPPYEEEDDLITQAPGVPPASQILDKYIQAVGGAQRLASLKSFIATGSEVGYSGLGDAGTFQILAKFPDQRATSVVYKDHPERGDNTRTFDGHTGWIRTPRAMLREYELTGTELNGARLDAMLSFPGQMKQAVTGLRSGFPDTIDGHPVDIVQGTGPGGILVTLYFDKGTGLLTRMLRFGNTPIGHNPTQVDYADYRDVDGIKFPFQYTFSWLDGRESYRLTGVKTNVPIDAAKFGKPN